MPLFRDVIIAEDGSVDFLDGGLLKIEPGASLSLIPNTGVSDGGKLIVSDGPPFGASGVIEVEGSNNISPAGNQGRVLLKTGTYKGGYLEVQDNAEIRVLANGRLTLMAGAIITGIAEWVGDLTDAYVPNGESMAVHDSFGNPDILLTGGGGDSGAALINLGTQGQLWSVGGGSEKLYVQGAVEFVTNGAEIRVQTDSILSLQAHSGGHRELITNDTAQYYLVEKGIGALGADTYFRVYIEGGTIASAAGGRIWYTINAEWTGTQWQQDSISYPSYMSCKTVGSLSAHEVIYVIDANTSPWTDPETAAATRTRLGGTSNAGNVNPALEMFVASSRTQFGTGYTPVKNTLYAGNICKAWATGSTQSDTIAQSFNVGSTSNTWGSPGDWCELTVNFLTPFRAIGECMVVSNFHYNSSGSGYPIYPSSPVNKSSSPSSVTLRYRNMTGGVIVDPDSNDIKYDIAVFGYQDG